MTVTSATYATGVPAFTTRGIIEGFYGPPWSHEQRLDMIDFIAQRGMNAFMYAPKDDPLMRHQWREPYTGARLDQLKELVARCEHHHITFTYCISPGLTIEYSNQDDIALLSEKLDSVAKLGVTSFGLLLDDIPRKLQHTADRATFHDLVEAHIAVTTTVFDRLMAVNPRHRLIVCPTLYWGYGDEDYVTRIGESLDPRIDVFWTGRAICSASIDLTDAAAITRTLARPVIYWDNYPVNDVAMGHELHIGPYRGRDRHLYRFSAGIIANGMSRGESSKIAFSTIADYLWDPAGYEADASWRKAIHEVMGNEDDAEAMLVFGDNVRSSCLEADDAPTVSHAVEQFLFLAGSGHRDDAQSVLRPVVDRLLQAADRLLRGPVVNRALIDEARPWLEAFEDGARALDFVCDTCGDGTVSGATAVTLASYRRQFAEHGKRVYGDLIDMTLADLIASAEPSAE